MPHLLFSNLIGNALKFTPSGGRVSVSGWRATPGVRFAVEDSGPGIPLEDQGHVFDGFWQAHNTSGQTEIGTPGTGEDRHWVTTCRQP